jgi:hypothetical protein
LGYVLGGLFTNSSGRPDRQKAGRMWTVFLAENESKVGGLATVFNNIRPRGCEGKRFAEEALRRRIFPSAEYERQTHIFTTPTRAQTLRKKSY